ncbi:peptidylprolyl isomerase [Polynucleobacter sp. MWH-CaK5]|jgi:peptidyl-prolyl cis-trans isomerase A (cyclophilin A)|uniref:peptidylprolyl isomerase n=1 Tax=Polynucleobacter sp. MWH-CaK5 TaxID=2689107 RepID=UPI001BFCEE1B|nr:peptidylprolyl isomerase [Polynucleobacter sp. MWH-CaK5]QWD89655.1 peptidylprolyl isomerase [Polynucleobacter sp. MWH-CaK5]
MKKLLAALLLTASTLSIAGPKVEFKTSMGDFVVELNPEKAPKTVENFLGYVNSGFYNGTIFHRVINNFMVQGGGFTPDMQQKPTKAPIPLESNNGLSNVVYSIAMARTNVPDSATAQFFVNVVNNKNLDFPRPDGHGYAVFGMVIKGTETIDKIKAVSTVSKRPFADVPSTTIVINSAKVIGK